MYATFTVAYATDQLDMQRGVVLGAVVTYGLLVIALQPFFGRLSDRIGRRPINLFSVIVAATVGWAPMIAVQPAFYAELFGARVRYTGFAPSRELGAAIAGFSPLVSTALLSANGDKLWLVAVFFVGLSLISLVAFLYSRETKGVDMEDVDPSRTSSSPPRSSPVSSR